MYDKPISNNDKMATLLAITSFGLSGITDEVISNYCGLPTVPGVYVRVDTVLDWIQRINTTYYT